MLLLILVWYNIGTACTTLFNWYIKLNESCIFKMSTQEAVVYCTKLKIIMTMANLSWLCLIILLTNMPQRYSFILSIFTLISSLLSQAVLKRLKAKITSYRLGQSVKPLHICTIFNLLWFTEAMVYALFRVL